MSNGTRMLNLQYKPNCQIDREKKKGGGGRPDQKAERKEQHTHDNSCDTMKLTGMRIMKKKMDTKTKPSPARIYYTDQWAVRQP